MEIWMIALIVVAGAILLGPLLGKAASALGIGSGVSNLDKLVSTLSTVLQKVEGAAMLSPIGRTAMCGIVIFIGKVVKLFPDGETKTSCLAAVRTLGDAFVDPNSTVEAPPPAVTVQKVS